MSKTLVNIFTNPIALIDQRAGDLISGAVLTAVGIIVPGAQFLIPIGLSRLGAGLGPGPQKPTTTQTSLKSATPPRVSAYGRVRLFWAWILYETAPDGWAVDVGVFHDGQLDAVETYYIGDKVVTVLSGGWVQEGDAGEWGNNDSVRVGVRLGLPTETAFAEVIAKVPDIWTANHRGDGCATGFMLSKNVKAQNFQKIYATGGPNNATLSIVARAQRVFDWRDPDQDIYDPDTWTWSENWVLHTAHYLMTRMDRDWAREFLPALSYWTAAADDADEASPLKGGGTEARYRSCVAHQHTQPHKDVLSALLSCGDGWLATRSDNALVIYSGRYYEPTVTIGPDEIVSYSLQEGVDEENAINTLKITYISSEHDFTSVDTDDWSDEGDIAARGKILSTALENQVPSHSQARRLGKREMSRVLAPQRGSTTTNSAGKKVLGERYIRQLIAEAGVTFQYAVVEVTKIMRNPQTGGLTYEWVLADPNVDSWNPATEEGDPAPVGERVAREPLDPPTIDSITPTYGQNTAYGVPGVKLTIEVTGPDRDDLTWYVRTRAATGGVAWLEQRYPDVDPGASVTLQTDFLPIDELEVEVAYSTGDGRLSPWATFDPVSTDDALPGDLTGLSVTANPDGMLIAADWNDSPNATSYLFELIVEP